MQLLIFLTLTPLRMSGTFEICRMFAIRESLNPSIDHAVRLRLLQMLLAARGLNVVKPFEGWDRASQEQTARDLIARDRSFTEARSQQRLMAFYTIPCGGGTKRLSAPAGSP